MTITEHQQQAYIAGQAADARIRFELETEGMTLNIGPQHPATHGTLRIVVRLDGEQVVWADPVPGYMHRGYEKLVEVRKYQQVTTLINRIDWLGSFCNEVPFILAAETLYDVEAPPRAQWIRTILFELGRIANVSLFLGDMGVQLGAITPVFFAFRDREHVLNLIEAATGGRFHPNYDRVGGLKEDLPKGWVEECKSAMDGIETFCDEMETLLMGNEIFAERCRGIGVIPRQVALDYGLSGANARASGIDWDLRRDAAEPARLEGGRLEGLDPSGRRLLRPLLGPPPGDARGRQDRAPALRRPSLRTGHGQDAGPPARPEGRGVGQHREPPRRDGLLRGQRRRSQRPVPLQDPHPELQQHLDRAVAAARRVRPRRHHDPRQPVLHPRGHRPLDVRARGTSIGAAVPVALSYPVETAIKMGVVLGVIPVGAMIFGYVFLFKMMAHMQSRLGPMEAGPHGSLQVIMEGVKFLQKEDLMPANADSPVFKLAPMIAIMSTFLIYAVIPVGPDLVISNLDVGIFYALAVGSLSVLGVLMAGWASANKYSLLGALRAAGQLIAYELPLVLAVVGVVIQAGTMSLSGIVIAQAEGEIFGFGGLGNPFILTQFFGFLIFLVAAQAELTQAPFDMPVAESELVAGYMTEYSGFRFLLFFGIAEPATAFGLSAIAATLFLGGWSAPGLGTDMTANFLGPLVLGAKIMLVAFFIFWFRFTYPRLREDQLQTFAWKYLIPLSLVNIAATAVLKVVF